jgi:hypothetical protein
MAKKVFDIINDAALSGTWKALFAEGDFSTTPTLDPIYYDFGNLGPVALNQELTTRPRYRYECGQKVLDQTLIQEQAVTIDAQMLTFPRETLNILFRGEEGDAYGQASLAAVEVDTLAFATTPAVIGRFYQLTNADKKIFNVTDLTLTEGANTLVEGTDYVLEKVTGMVRFLTAQTADVTVTVTADAFDEKAITLHQSDVRTGKFRLLYFPAKETNGAACEPEIIIDGIGEVVFEEGLTIGSESDAEPNVGIKFTDDPEIYDLRTLA